MRKQENVHKLNWKAKEESALKPIARDRTTPVTSNDPPEYLIEGCSSQPVIRDSANLENHRGRETHHNVKGKEHHTGSLVLQAATGGCIMGTSFAGVLLSPAMFQLTGAIGILIGLAMMGIAWSRSRQG